MKRKCISIILTISMVVALIPSLAFATDEMGDMQVPDISSNEEESLEGYEEPSYNIEDYTFTLSQGKYYYDGKQHRPDVICSELEEGVAYTVEYEYYDEELDEWYLVFDDEFMYAGKYRVAITGVEPYEGGKSLYYSILATSISLNKSSVTLYRKGTFQLKTTVKNANGKTTYSSSNTKAATVRATGKITAIANGTATITVKNGFAKKTVKVTVKNPYLNKKSVAIVKQKTFQLKVTGKIGKATFKSSNKKIATVSSSGKIKAKKKGKCTITVTANGITLKCKVTVKNPPPVYITKTGKRYHCDPDCWGLRNARAIYKVSLSKAKKKKLTPCHVCY